MRLGGDDVPRPDDAVRERPRSAESRASESRSNLARGTQTQKPQARSDDEQRPLLELRFRRATGPEPIGADDDVEESFVTTAAELEEDTVSVAWPPRRSRTETTLHEVPPPAPPAAAPETMSPLRAALLGFVLGAMVLALGVLAASWLQ